MNSYPDTSDQDSDDSTRDRPDQSEELGKPCAPDPEDCDSKAVAKVRCRAVGIDAQADFNKEYQPPLDAAEETYNAARRKYRETRAEVACTVRDLKHDISCLIKRIRCLIKQEHVVECLDEAFNCVTYELDECDKRTPELDCCFDDDCDGLTLEQVTQRIGEYKVKLEAAKSRFNWLAGEPARLKERVEKAAAEVKAVEDALKADPAVTDPKKLYVQAIVAWYHLQIIWGYFTTVSKFIDALCEALTCWRDAVVTVSRLVRCQAELECYKKAKDQECERLKLHTVDEILVVYERLCGHKYHDDCGHGHGPCDDDDDSDKPCDDDDKPDPDDDDYDPYPGPNKPNRYGDRDRDDDRRRREDERNWRRRGSAD